MVRKGVLDAFYNLALTILEIKKPLVCRLCGVKIEKPLKEGNICKECNRLQNQLRQARYRSHKIQE